MFTGRLLSTACVRLSVVVPLGLALAGCTTWGVTHEGSGRVSSAPREVPSFDAVHVRGSAELAASVGPAQSLEISWDDNLHEHVRTDVEGTTLVISLDPGSYSSKQPLRVRVSTPKLAQLEIHGSGDARVEGLDGAGFRASVHGSGSIEALGRCAASELAIHGSGNADFHALEASTAKVEIHGSGDVKVYAAKELDVSVHGSGDVLVYGEPAVLNKVVAGSGSVRSAPR